MGVAFLKKNRVVNLIMIMVFAVAIALPLLFANTVPNQMSAAENRELANFPQLFFINHKINKDFTQNFESWFNDNLGFREQIVKVSTYLQYHVFGKLAKSDTMLGKSNWLYYTTPGIISDYQNMDLPSQKDLASWGGAVAKTNEYLKKNKIPFIYTLNVDKKTVYPENYPSSILKVTDISRTQLFLDYMKKNTSVDYFTPLETLTAAKKTEKVYYQNADNAHWNNAGAFLGYQDLMQHIRKYLPGVRMLTKDDFNLVPRTIHTSVYNSVSFSEQDTAYNLKKPTAHLVPNALDQLNLIYPYLNYLYVNNNPKLPKIMVVGDSYFYSFELPALAESFSQVTFIHTYNIGRLQNLVEIFHPDLVVYENVEREFPYDIGLWQNTPETYQVYADDQGLPVKSASTAASCMNYCDNIKAGKDAVSIKRTSDYVDLTGWAYDSDTEKPASAVFVKVGNHVYQATYGIARTDIDQLKNKPQLQNVGFSLYVNAQELRDAGSVSIIVVSNDKTYQYQANSYHVALG